MVSSKHVKIKFKNTGYEKTVIKSLVRQGMIKDPNSRSVYGVGLIGEGHKAQKDGKMFRPYVLWKEMLRRCYDVKHLAKYPIYRGCEVSPRWHNY